MPPGRTVGHWRAKLLAVLTGKRKPKWTPFIDMGDYVIVVNARKAVFKGFQRPSRSLPASYEIPGGLRETSVKENVCKPSGAGN